MEHEGYSDLTLSRSWRRVNEMIPLCTVRNAQLLCFSDWDVLRKKDRKKQHSCTKTKTSTNLSFINLILKIGVPILKIGVKDWLFSGALSGPCLQPFEVQLRVRIHTLSEIVKGFTSDRCKRTRRIRVVGLYYVISFSLTTTLRVPETTRL